MTIKLSVVRFQTGEAVDYRRWRDSWLQHLVPDVLAQLIFRMLHLPQSAAATLGTPHQLHGRQSDNTPEAMGLCHPQRRLHAVAGPIRAAAIAGRRQTELFFEATGKGLLGIELVLIGNAGHAGR